MLNTSASFRAKVYDQVRKFKAQATIEMEVFADSNFRAFRYIRDWINGSTANTNNYWNSIKVFSNEVDLARGILPTSNTSLINAVNITDGNDTTYGYSYAGLFYAQIDLGQVRYDIDKIQVIHYYADGRTFYDSKIEISENGVDWFTLRDSAVSGTYAETSSGITLLPNTQTIRTYDDNTIVRMNILEEMSTLNESLPSNELQLTMDNSNGDFDLLNFANMQKILASKPTIQTELGLLLFELEESETFTNNLEGKIYGSYVENPNKYFYRYASSLPSPQDFSAEATQTHIDRVYTSDNSTSMLTTVTNGYTPYGLWRFDMIEILERRYGEGIWMGKTSRADKALLCEEYVGYMTAYWRGYGSTPTGKTATLRLGSGSSYFGTTRSHTSGSVSTLSISTSSITSAITWDGYVNVCAYSGASDGVTASELRTDNIWLDVRVDPFEAIEWHPTGKFFLTEWRNEITSKIITLIGNDYFELFSNISYEPTTITNLKSLAIDVLTKGGVPVENQIIDESLSAITVNPFPERIDIRTALQHIGVASGSAVSQDRLGNVFIKPFKTLDESTNYITYTTSQQSLFGYAGGNAYPLNDTGGGMRYLDFGQMYEAPKITLEKSVYQLVVIVYINGVPTERIYTNEFIEGTNGQSFTIDNPLINSAERADKVAEWYIREINYNAIYTARWRQNPALECADIILVEDSFNAEKQTRIIKQEMNYSGFLEGITESRGGI